MRWIKVNKKKVLPDIPSLKDYKINLYRILIMLSNLYSQMFLFFFYLNDHLG